MHAPHSNIPPEPRSAALRRIAASSRNVVTGARDVVSDCAARGVVLVAYCPLGAWPSALAAKDDAHVAEIAARVGRTPAQVVLRWALQQGAAVLTKSHSLERLREAAAVVDFGTRTATHASATMVLCRNAASSRVCPLQVDFELSEADMARVSGLAWLVQPPSFPYASTTGRVADALGVQAIDEQIAQEARAAAREL